MKTACSNRTITGPNHSGAKLHGFLSFWLKNAPERSYQIIGYKGKQVRDNIHSKDLTKLWNFIKDNQ